MRTKDIGQPSVTNLRDLSHVGAKRLSATLVLGRHCERDDIRLAIRDAADELRRNTHCRDSVVRDHWGNTYPHVVWLDVAFTGKDAHELNWVCQAHWIDPSLEKDMRPACLPASEMIGNTAVTWNALYEPQGA